MNRSHLSSAIAGALALALTALAQTTPSTDPMPPAPPRTDAPGSPINPRQGTPAEVAPVTPNPTPSPEQSAPSTPLRDLNFAEADADGDKRISLTEYTTFVESRVASRGLAPLTDETLERFRQLDQDNDAFLSENEARNAPQPVIPATAAPKQ